MLFSLGLSDMQRKRRTIASKKIACLFIMFVAESAFDLPAMAREHGTQRDPGTITTIVIHTVGGPSCISNRVAFRPVPFRADDAAFWRYVLRSAPVVDAHIVIGRSGAVADVIPFAEVAHHTVGANAASVGVELVHRGDGIEPFESAQLAALVDTIKVLRRRFPGISLDRIVRHSDLDQRTCMCGAATYRRRQDPGANFPMERVIAAVRQPADPPRGAATLDWLAGPAPAAACPIF